MCSTPRAAVLGSLHTQNSDASACPARKRMGFACRNYVVSRTAPATARTLQLDVISYEVIFGVQVVEVVEPDVVLVAARVADTPMR